NEGFRGPVATVDIGTDWGKAVFEIKPLSDVPEWQLAVVVSMGDNEARIGLRPDADALGQPTEARKTATLAGGDIKWVSRKLSAVLQVGDVVYVSPVTGKPDH